MKLRTQDETKSLLQKSGLIVGANLSAQSIIQQAGLAHEHQSAQARSVKAITYVVVVGEISILGLSWVALFNWSPLVFSDSIAYTTAALKGEVPGLFSVFYSYLIVPFHGGISLWPVVFAQATMMAHLIHLVIRGASNAPQAKSATPLAIALLCVFSSLPWVVGQVMPDVFTSVLVLGIYLLAFCSHALSRNELIYVAILTAIATTTHLSHVPIAVGLAIICWVSQWAIQGIGMVSKRFLILVAAPVAIAIAAMFAVNFISAGQWKLARNSNVFMLAKWIDEGPALSHLERNCPNTQYALCDYVEELKGLTHDDLKWGGHSPFHKSGGFDSLEPEAALIIRNTFLEFPMEIIALATFDFLKQMTRFGAGDGLTPTYAKLVAPHLSGLYDPAVERAVLNSRQARGTLPIGQFRALHLAALAVSLIFCVICFIFWRGTLPTRLKASYLYLPLAIVWNAVVTGGLSGAYDRYLARVVWIIPLVAVISALLVIQKFISSDRIPDLTAEELRTSPQVSNSVK
jgi:hypothetical protein